ncbi:SDR family oxidoreductase [Ruegeria sp.]|uniref:SDR family NAD(P)-dependent oxidoreductase n=1 Tax=Ruegeria sp. TaxID=1879320 RepID=UPI00231DE2FE|nr:SDR family oxidoreductase [Ruegeria sp.]MDA7965326.1 SDR family oxidoreductase [Ruegeria sp.]
MTELTGKTALVTGAAQGIGAAVAAALADAGARVIGADMKAPRAPNPAIRFQHCDISDAQSVAALFADIADTEGQLDFAINSAGVLSESPITSLDVAEFDRVIAINLRGSFLIAQGAARMMQQAGSGRIILVSSELAYLGRGGFSAYCASKSGVIGLTRSLARELAPDIQVNSIAPGPVDTPMLALENMSQEAINEEADNPLGRLGTPQEVAGLARFLCGPDAGFFTGQTLSPNGGAVMI